VRLVITSAGGFNRTTRLTEIDVHDASAGTSDTWMFLGDSITAIAYDRSLGAGDFPSRVNAALPDHYPAMLSIGLAGATTADALARIDYWLAVHPDMRQWVLSYGTNDSGTGDPSLAPAFGARLRMLVAKLRDAGKVVLIPHIPYKTGGEWYLDAYNAQIDAVRAEFGLGAAPDFYAWFNAHRDELRDGVHPNEAGALTMNRMWAEAAKSSYLDALSDAVDQRPRFVDDAVLDHPIRAGEVRDAR
jgi:lysophospholipase L1-like esterase